MIFSVSLLAQPVASGLSLVNFLKTKYMGLTISYEVTILDKKKRDTGERMMNTGEIVEVVIGANGYKFNLDNGDKVDVLFEVSQRGNLRTRRFRTSQHNIDMEVLRAEQFMNGAISSVGTGGSASGLSAGTVDLNQYSGLLESANGDLSQGEEIIYTDLRVNRERKGNVVVSRDGLYLENGSPIELRFVSEQVGSKKKISL
jgi:hypothetical protein